MKHLLRTARERKALLGSCFDPTPTNRDLVEKARVVNIRSSGVHFSLEAGDRELLQLVVTVEGLDGAHRARA
jgi:hypothetical protein